MEVVMSNRVIRVEIEFSTPVEVKELLREDHFCVIELGIRVYFVKFECRECGDDRLRFNVKCDFFHVA
jgi:predicted RNA-binding Zn-ribbon protein involved in translation (DUF1610 family)